MGLKYAVRRDMDLGQFCGLLLLAVAGAMIMVSTANWLIVFLGLEVLSVASYAMTGLKRNDAASSEAAAKYFLLGSFAGAFFVFGLAFVYGTSGEPGPDFRPRPGRHRRSRAHPDRPLLQDRPRAVPHVGAGRLRRRSDPGHRLPDRRAQGRRAGRPDQDPSPLRRGALLSCRSSAPWPS